MAKRFVLGLRFSVLILAAVGYAAQPRADAQYPNPCPTQQHLAEQLLRGINALRAASRRCGAIPYSPAPNLVWSELLFHVAQGHAADMAARDYFSHNSPEGLTPMQRAENAGYDWSQFGENIGAGPTSVQGVLGMWLKSAPHCQGMMKPEYREVALACAQADDGRLLWVLELGLPRGMLKPGELGFHGENDIDR